jgi:site-specific recombinase XerD
METSAIRMVLVKSHAPATVRLTLTVMRSVMKAAFNLGIITADEFMRATSWPRLRAYRLPKGRALSETEIARLRAHCASARGIHGIQLGALVATLTGGGLRREEIATLRIDSLAGRDLRVMGKGQKERIVPLPMWVVQSLTEWLTIRRHLRVTTDAMFIRIDSTDRVFDYAMSPWGVWSQVRRVCRACGITDIAPHDFRRTYASALIDTQGISTAAMMLGHASIATTAIYDRRGDKAKTKAADSLEGWGML